MVLLTVNIHAPLHGLTLPSASVACTCQKYTPSEVPDVGIVVVESAPDVYTGEVNDPSGFVVDAFDAW